jgi:hypothetical protein
MLFVLQKDRPQSALEVKCFFLDALQVARL